MDGWRLWPRSVMAGFAIADIIDLDWFERLTGFTETDYASTRTKLKVRRVAAVLSLMITRPPAQAVLAVA